MEGPSIHWEMEEGHYSSEESGGKVSWILRKGLVLGRKILVTGIVISSAPFVLPPLVAISALGFAASVPSRFFLASYVCSEKLMSSLLPESSPYPLLLGYGEGDKTEQVGEDIGFDRDIDMGKEEDELVEDVKEGLEMKIEFPVKHVNEKIDEKEKISGVKTSDLPEDDLQGVVLTVEADERASDKFVKNDQTPMEVRDVVIMESGGQESIEEGELARETRGLIEKLRDEGKDREQLEVAGEQGRLEKEKQIVENVEETDIPIEAKSVAKKPKRKGTKKGKVDEKRVEEVPKQSDENREYAIHGRGEKHLLEGRKQSEEKGTNNTKKSHFEIADKLDARTLTTETPEGKVVEGRVKAPKVHLSGRLAEEKPGLKGIGSPLNEGLESEEKIWKQIKAMRTIVGYKRTPQESCFEELKALYLFTGVEPPESFKDPSDLEELGHKLRFLKSIVGVK